MHASSPALDLIQRSEAARQAALVILFGALTAVSAQIQIPLQPVPVTGTVLMALLAGALLGPRLGFLSQVAYLAIGVMGAPVFAGGKSTILTLLGPTGGYLIGFPIGAYVAGALAQRVRSLPALFLALFAGSAVILLLGGLWLGVGATLVSWPGAQNPSGLPAGIAYGFAQGILPFLPLDLVKVAAATAVAWPVIRNSRGAGLS
jgi:biotin transport system substrate-specific component